MNRALGSLLFLSLASCAPGPGGAVGPSPAGLAIREAPAEVHGYPRTDFKRYEMASAGVSYRYGSGPPIIRDVYVYPLTPTAGAGGDDPVQRARSESDNLKAVFEIQRRERRVERFEVAADSAIAIPIPGGTVRGWHLSGRVVHRNGVDETHQHVFAIGDQLLKVRTTYTVNAPNASADVDAFVRDLLRRMLGPA
jgi:hypothetical protein